MKLFIKNCLILQAVIIFNFLLNSCATTNPNSIIQPVDFYGNSFIKLGDTANIKWNFKNASQVHIDNLNRNYDAIDSIKVFPKEKTAYNFKVSNATDTANYVWNVFIEDDKEISKGPSKFSNDEPSYIESEFLNGIIQYNLAANIKKMKIMRTIYPFEDKNVIRFYTLLLDDFGNYISDLEKPESGAHFWNANNSCDDASSKELSSNEMEIKSNEPVLADILLDNSAISGDYFPIINQVKEFLLANDSEYIGLKLINQRLINSIPINNAINKKELISKIEMAKPSGFSSIYRFLYQSIDELVNNTIKSQKISIMIAFSQDNSSLIYDRNDALNLAKKFKIPIYIIGVGNAVDSYSFKYLCENSGGRYYQINDDELMRIKYILNEIVAAQKMYYQIDVSVSPEITDKCKSFTPKLILSSSKGNVFDTSHINLYAERQAFKYQAVAAFDYKDTVLSGEFNDQLINLSQILKDNPSKIIELIGNSSIEGNDDFTTKISLRRAQIVRNALIQLGSNPKQIRIRGNGSNNPLYYIQENNWTQYYNRRVEVRWLDPELMPFELIISQHKTETEALTNVEDWENRGFRTYYERYLQNNYPIYRVKIWGYKTYDEAKTEAQNLSKSLNREIFVQ